MSESHVRVANEAHRGLVSGFGGRIAASLVWDGTDEVRIPSCMASPRSDQMQGTARERLVELAGRTCYESMSKGRSSVDYAKHLLEVGHLSVLEHAAMTVEFTMKGWDGMSATRASVLNGIELSALCLNRPTLYVRTYRDDGGHRVRVTLNPRHVREWEGEEGSLSREQQWFWVLLREATQAAAPSLLPGLLGSDLVEDAANNLEVEAVHLVEPETDDEKWVSLYLTGSRGWSHEIVRHGDWTAISQRSTRYVDESESEWVLHPLLAKWITETGREPNGDLISTAAQAKGSYEDVVKGLEAFLLNKKVDKVSARKQARGAARGLLGNALETEMIFSASVRQWLWMLKLRGADAADAEIRQGFVEAVLPCLQSSRYGDRFQGIELRPASDGIGKSLVLGAK